MSASGSETGRPPVVLVVDDEPQIRAFLSLMLGDAGFTVYAAEDGVAALALLQTLRPAAIVTDLMMPRMDGWGLRASAETAAIPLVVISALRSAETPGDAYFPKPFELDALVATLRRLTTADRAQSRTQTCATVP
jgi:DNA-binding response OmpR family regulator